jgi:hypothetical protein
VNKHSNFVAGLCLYLLAGLFAFNSYADEVTIEYQGGTYIGEVVGGVPHGQGIWTHLNQKKYVGEFKDGLLNGQGTWKSAGMDSRIFNGRFVVSGRKPKKLTKAEEKKEKRRAE